MGSLFDTLTSKAKERRSPCCVLFCCFLTINAATESILRGQFYAKFLDNNMKDAQKVVCAILFTAAIRTLRGFPGCNSTR